jgi:hypothetical protein
MVTSALSTKSFLSIGSTWQLPSRSLVKKEDSVSGEVGMLTETESRLADAHEAEVESSLKGSGEDVEVRSKLEGNDEEKEGRRTQAERRIQELDQRDQTKTTPAVAECFTKVMMRELDEYDARNEVASLEIEEAFRFEQLMGNTTTYEPGYRVFTWAMDWAFDEATNEDEIPLAVQMRLWEEDERRKMKEERTQSSFTQWRTQIVEEPDEGLNLGRLYEELRSLGHNHHTRIRQEQEQAGREWQPDEWIRTSVWILEELGGNHQEDVEQGRKVGLRVFPRT